MSESIQVGFGQRQRQLKVLRYLTDFYSGGPGGGGVPEPRKDVSCFPTEYWKPPV